MDAEIEIEGGQSYSVTDNFAEDFIEFGRSQMVQNECQALVTQFGVASGYLNDWRFFNSVIVTGSSSGGKSHMLREVIKESLEYANASTDGEFLYELSGGSNKAGIDDDLLDAATVAYFHEMNKIPDEMLEFIKSISEDGGFKYGRNIQDSDSRTGRSTVHIDKEPLPILFSFADENESASGDDQELRTRLVEVKVAENEEKNEAVHRMKWGEKHITLSSSPHEYVFDAPDVSHRVKSHMRDIPRNLEVVLPTDDGQFTGDDWHAGKVTSPMFNFKRSESTRASTYLANLVRGSVALNYHNRNTWCPECGAEHGPDESVERDYECACGEKLHVIVEPQDVGNLIACRITLLPTTHNLTAKKFAIIDAIIENGSPVTGKDTAMQAENDQIIEYIQQSTDIATMSKSEIKKHREELVEQLILNKIDHPDDARKNMYVYDGAETFKEPDIYQYYDQFKDVTDPIRDQPIEQTIEEQLDELNASIDTSVSSLGASMSAADAMGNRSDSGAVANKQHSQTNSPESLETSDSSLSSFDSSGDSQDTDLSDAAQRTFSVMKQTLGTDATVGTDVQLEHMVGVTPVTDDGSKLVAERQPSGYDKRDGFMSPDNWDECGGFDEVESTIVNAIEELKAVGKLSIEQSGDGVQVSLS